MGIIKQDSIKKKLYIKKIYKNKRNNVLTKKTHLNISTDSFKRKIKTQEIFKLFILNVALIALFALISFCGYFIHKFVSY